jgi:hypothetical protein
MKKNATIGSEPSKIHYGGAPKNPTVIPAKSVNSTGNDDDIVRGAQEGNLKRTNRGTKPDSTINKR